MKKVYKYEFPIGDFVLALPAGFEILSVQTQFNKPCMWVLVDPHAPKHDVFLRSLAPAMRSMSTVEYQGSMPEHSSWKAERMFFTFSGARRALKYGRDQNPSFFRADFFIKP